MNLIEALTLVLPMAKGYAHEHPVGHNQQKVEEAERTLELAKLLAADRPNVADSLGTICWEVAGYKLGDRDLASKILGRLHFHGFDIVPVEDAQPAGDVLGVDYSIARARIRAAGARLKNTPGAIVVPESYSELSNPHAEDCGHWWGNRCTCRYLIPAEPLELASGAVLDRYAEILDCEPRVYGEADSNFRCRINATHHRHTAGISGPVTRGMDMGGPDHTAVFIALEDDADQALVHCEHCTQHRCQEWHGQILVKPRLVLRGGFWVCPKCGGSYGPEAIRSNQEQSK